MNDIIHPYCKKVFKVDKAGFADITHPRDVGEKNGVHTRCELEGFCKRIRWGTVNM